MTTIPVQDRNHLPCPKILILGHGRHGKDTVAEIMSENYGLSFRGSSEFCAEHVVWPAMSASYYPTWKYCYEDRANNRALWHQAIAAYNQPDPTRLAIELLASGVDIYVGMRSNREYQACMAAELFDYVFWVDAGNRRPEEGKDSFDIEFNEEEMFLIENRFEGREALAAEVDIYKELLEERKEYMLLTPRRLAAIKNIITALDDEGYGCGGIKDLKAVLGNLDDYPEYWKLVPKN